MADNLFTALSASENEDADELIKISSDLRTMEPSGPFRFGVYNDTNVRTLKFEIPRFFDEIDFSEYDIFVLIKNANGEIDVEAITDAEVGETITFNWVLKRFVFYKEGTVSFQIRLQNSDKTKLFHTAIHYGTVLKGLEVDNPSTQALIYRLEQLRDAALESEDDEVVVGIETFTASQLTELINYLEP